ncbi:MAG TPA: hypothetical protein VH280_18850 [Verrucomicrobiae bacterium]|jgi:hypothetical protein|nr:hypothetical protein [Verrucomicrobiae bacterium]
MNISLPFRHVLLFALGLLVSRANAATPSPMPPLETVMQRVMETSAVENAQYHQFNQHYFYTRDKVTEFYDGAGKLKQRHEKQSTNNPTPPFVLTTSAPAPTQGAATQTASSPKEAQKAEPPNIHGVALGKKEDLMNPDIVKRFKFTLVGRDTLNGRSALIVDFAPVSDSLPILNIKDRFINSCEGRAWVDEKDFTLEKVDLHLKQKVSVLGGVAGSVSNFTFSLLRERTPDGFWFTRNLDWHVDAREATLRRVVDHHEEILGVQKLR